MASYNFEREFIILKRDAGLMQRIECSLEETEEYQSLSNEKKFLPVNVWKEESGYVRYIPEDMESSAVNEHIQLLQLKSIDTIKKCIIFFVCLTIAAIVIGFFYWIYLMTLLS